MKSYGHLDFNNNQMQRMALQEEASFPSPAVVGRIAFKDKRVWICVEITAGVPAWVPLTGMNSTHLHDQTTPAVTWTVTHNLNAGSPLVQVYDDDGYMMIPQDVVPTSNDTLEITLNGAQAGRAVVMFGDPTVYPVA